MAEHNLEAARAITITKVMCAIAVKAPSHSLGAKTLGQSPSKLLFLLKKDVQKALSVPGRKTIRKTPVCGDLHVHETSG
jgi:hypothetical protein